VLSTKVSHSVVVSAFLVYWAIGGGTAMCADSTHQHLTAADLVQVRDIGGVDGKGLSVSPDGRYVAVEQHQADVPRDTYTVHWLIVGAVDHATLRFVADGGDPSLFKGEQDDGTTSGAWITERPAWLPDSRSILVRRREHGETQIWSAGLDQGAAVQLTHNAADVQGFVLADRGTKVFFKVAESRSMKTQHNVESDESGYRFDDKLYWSLLEGRSIRPRYELVGGPRIWVYELQTHVEREATAPEIQEFEDGQRKIDGADRDSGAKRVVAYDKAGKKAAWLSPAFTDKQGRNPPMALYASIGKDRTTARRCVAPECTGMYEYETLIQGGIRWSDSGSEVLFARLDGANNGHRALYAWNPSRNTVRRILATFDWLTDCLPVDQQAICFLETPTHPRRLISVNLKSGATQVLYDPNPEFDKFALGSVERLEWRDALGQETFGYLVRPINYRAGNSYPLIVVGYRGKRALRGGTGDEYPVQLFAAHGFAVLVYDMADPIEVEASAASLEESFLRSWGPRPVEIVRTLSLLEAIIDKLGDQKVVDTHKVGITGFSNGATLAAYAWIHSNHFAAASMSSITWDPIGYYLSGGGPYKDLFRRAGFGRPGSPDDRAWKELSLSENTALISAPILINSSDDEYHAAMGAVRALSDADKPIEMFIYPNEFHVKWHPQHRLHIYERNVDWFDFWLNGTEDRESSKTDQYARWRQMRAEIHAAK